MDREKPTRQQPAEFPQGVVFRRKDFATAASDFHEAEISNHAGKSANAIADNLVFVVYFTD